MYVYVYVGCGCGRLCAKLMRVVSRASALVILFMKYNYDYYGYILLCL